jgi:hypothetical protein
MPALVLSPGALPASAGGGACSASAVEEEAKARRKESSKARLAAAKPGKCAGEAPGDATSAGRQFDLGAKRFVPFGDASFGRASCPGPRRRACFAPTIPAIY